MIGWIFPGQGSQHVGMTAGMTSPPAREVFADAARILGWDVRQACDEPGLDETEVAQPAIVTTSVAAARTLESMGVLPDMVAGHSVGEFSALVAACALSFEDALRAVAERAAAMAAAARENPGAMAAVVGLDASRCEEICAAVDGPVVVAAVNAPDQVVLSGAEPALAEAAAAARGRGARVRRLSVSVAAHSPLMEPAIEPLRRALASVGTVTPLVPVVDSVTAHVHDTDARIPGYLVPALTQPVRWTDCVRTLHAQGIDTFVEVGPGHVLGGLVRRIVPGARIGGTEGGREVAGLPGARA